MTTPEENPATAEACPRPEGGSGGSLASRVWNYPLCGVRLSFVIVLTAFLFSVFAITSSQVQFGYENENIRVAEAWVRGQSAWGRSGVLEIAVYMPSAWIKKELAPTLRLISIQRNLYIFVQPALTALLCFMFYGLAVELFGRHETAAPLTLLLAFTTMIWPYSKYGMEVQQTLWTVASLWGAVVFSRRPSQRSALGFSLAMIALVLTKITGMAHCFVIALIALGLAVQERTWRRPGFGVNLALAIGVGLIGLAFFLVSNKLRSQIPAVGPDVPKPFGGWIWGARYRPGLEAADESHSFIEALWAFLFSFNKNIFLYSPVLLIGLWHYGNLLRRFPAMRPVLLGMFGLLAWYLLKSRHFNDETWGPRRAHFIVPIMMLPVGIWWERRREFHRVWRALAWVVIVLGLLAQLLAISFDYSAHPFVLGKRELYSTEHNVWLPDMNPFRFKWRLLQSTISRWRGEGSLDYIVDWHYESWNAPEKTPPPQRFDLDGYDRLDFWWLQEMRRAAPEPYWFRKVSSYLAILTAALFFASLSALIRLWPRPAKANP